MEIKGKAEKLMGNMRVYIGPSGGVTGGLGAKSGKGLMGGLGGGKGLMGGLGGGKGLLGGRLGS
jgi:hypothetical protein